MFLSGKNLNKAIEIDPLYKIAYNSLAYAYEDIGDFDKSIWAINEYISLAPDEANPYDSRADLYAYNGKLDQAIESYKKALEKKPDFSTSLAKLGHMYLFKREYVKAESCYKVLASSSDKDTRSEGRTYMAIVPLYQGKFEEALEVLNDGLAADRMEEVEAEQGWKHIFKADAYLGKKNPKSALKEVERAVEISLRVNPEAVMNWQEHRVFVLAENGDFKKAEDLAEVLKKDIEQRDQTLMPFYWWASGCIEFSKGNVEVSLPEFERAAEGVTNFYMDFMLAQAYLVSDRMGEAVAVLEKSLSRYDESRALLPVWAVKAHYLLGLAYEKSGWNKKAIEKYEEFLEIWKDADPGIPEVKDATERLEKLRGES